MHYIGLCIRSTHVDGTTRVQTKKTQWLRHTHPGPGQAFPPGTFANSAARPAESPPLSLSLNALYRPMHTQHPCRWYHARTNKKNTVATTYTPWPRASVPTLDFFESCCQDRAIPYLEPQLKCII